MITRELIEAIIIRLSVKGVKDTDLPLARLPLSELEKVVIVQDNKNRLLDIKELAKTGGSTKTIQDLENLILLHLGGAFPPTYLKPLVSVNISNLNLKIGDLNTRMITTVFVLNDAGPIISQAIFKNGILVSTTGTYLETGIIEELSTTYRVEVMYSQGPILNDSKGNPFPVGRIPTGMISSQRIITDVQTGPPSYWGEVGAIGAAEPNGIPQAYWASTMKSKLTTIVGSLANSQEKVATGANHQWWIVLIPKVNPQTVISQYHWEIWNEFSNEWMSYNEITSTGVVTLDNVLYDYTAIRPTTITKIKYTK